MALSCPIDRLIEQLPKCVKRGSYIKYSSHPDVVARILTILKANRRGDIQKISDYTKFKVRTLYNWRDKLLQDPNFNPLNKKTNQSKRIFTDEEEDSISDYIITQILMKGILFTDEDFRELILDAYLEKHKDDGEDSILPQFQASNGFIYDFKKNHRLTSKKCHFKRRPVFSKYEQSFIDAIEWLFANIDPTYIVNIDETSWELIPNNIRSWHPVGKDHVVRFTNANEKDRLTVVAGIKADGGRLPLQFIAKGKTEQVLDTQIGDVYPHLRSYSENGWTTENTFISYLHAIRECYGYDDPNTIHVILDVFKVHITDSVNQAAKDLNIKFYLIPAGKTDEIQPLDIRIFGPLKRFAAKLFRQRLKNDPDKPRTKRDACQDMVRSWETITPQKVKESFEKLSEQEYWIIEKESNEIQLWKHHRDYCSLTPAQRRFMRENMERN